jgi:anti-anti-sigma factor
MEIQEHRHGAVTVIKPRGPLVQADAEGFRASAGDAVGRSMGRCVVDASEVPYVDSQGLEALVALGSALEAAGRTLRMCGVTETVREVLDVTGLADRFEFFEDANAAVRSFL